MGVQINGSTGAVTGTQSDWSGNVSIGGTLTYEDVTNIDAVGLITARSGIEFGARPGVAASISVDGNMIMSGISTFGGNLNVNGSSSPEILNKPTDATPAYFVGDSNRTGAGQHLAEFKGRWNGNDVARIVFLAGADTTNKDDGVIRVDTTPSGGSLTERLRITSDGKIGMGENNPQRELHLTTAGNTGIRIEGGSSNTCQVLFTPAGGTEHQGRIGYYHGSNSMDFYTAASERMRIDSSGRVLVGHTGTLSEGCAFQIVNTTDNTAEFFAYAASTSGARLTLTKSRSGTKGTNTIVQSGDRLGEIHFRGADGSNYIRGATISAEVDGTPGTNDMPGRLVFSTTADGGSSQVERMRIRSDGRVQIKSGDLEVIAGEGVSAHLKLTSDEGDDNSDHWRLVSNQDDNDFEIQTYHSGTYLSNIRTFKTGEVTHPENCVFRAYGAGGATGYNSAKWDLANTNINRGSNYATSGNTGRFTAPVTGIYLFHVGFFPNSTFDVRVELRVNGSATTNPYINGWNSSMGSGTPSCSGGQILNLNANDYVEVYTNGNMTNTYNGHTGFSGVLIS